MNSADLTELLGTLRSLQDVPERGPAAAASARPIVSSSIVSPLPAALSSSVPPAFSPAQLNSLLSYLSPSNPTATPQYDPLVPVGRQEREESKEPERHRDLSTLSFPEAMPLLSSFTVASGTLRQLQKEQHEVERELLQVRRNCETALKDAPQKLLLELKKCDLAAIAFWIDLRSKQQRRLQSLGVPTFSVTDDPMLLARQARVLTVLLGYLDD